MGMYSYFDDEHIEVTDWEGLVEFFTWWEKERGEENSWYTTAEKMLNLKEKTCSFEEWTDLKLISYWYEETCLFLKLIAPYISGYVDFSFENKDEAGNFMFENGECIIQTGQMKYQSWKPQDNYDFNKVSPQVQKRLLVLELTKTKPKDL